VKSKLSIAVILGVLGLLTTLLVALPVLGSVQGTATLTDGADGDVIDWINPGATITLRVDDADLDVAVQKVIYTGSGSTDVAVQPGTVTTAGTTTLVHSTSTGSTLAVGDTILVAGETVREITAISGLNTTVSVAFSTSAGSLTAYEVSNASASYDDCPQCTGANVQTPSVADGGTQVIEISDLFDLLDSNVSTVANRFDGDADTRVNKQDVRIDLATGDDLPSDITFSVDLSNGSITLSNATSGATGTFTADIAVMYWYADENNTQDFVTVTSDADETGITVTLTETQSASGAFEATVFLCQTGDINCSSATTTTPRIKVGDSDTVTITYDDPDDSDATGNVTVEATAPSFANFSPIDGFATVASRPNISVDVTDGDSGVLLDSDDVPTITFVMQTTELDGTALDSAVTDAEPTTVAITGGFSANTLIPRTLTPNEDVYLVEWWVVTEDEAGNRGVSDNPDIEDADDDQTECDADAFNLDASGSTEADCDPYQIRVDLVGPALVSATTGNYFDTVDEEVQSGSDAISTSIQVVFDEALDEDSIQVTDFESDGTDITSVNWYSDEPESVFLTVDAMDADDEPTIDLVDDIADEAGNTTDDGDVDSTDGIAATLTVTVTGEATGDRPVTDETITVAITSDEPLTGAPVVTIHLVGDDAIGVATSTPSVSLVGTRSWESEDDVVTAGVYTVRVSGTDLGARIETTVGITADGVSTEIDLTSTSGQFFEVDNTVATATFPLTANDTDNVDTFISADFSNEGNEYGLDGDDEHTVTPGSVDTDHDSHGTLTLVSFTLDDVDVSADVSTTDNLVFLYKAAGLTLDEHTVVIEVEDVVGNSSGEVEHVFEVTERDLFEVPVVPGWNMVSFPGAPADSAIDSVIGTGVPVTSVYSYNPTIPGGWQTAVREAGADGTFGAFAGTLTTIDANLGYWVLTSTFEAIEVDIPAMAAGSATVGDTLPPQPPSIAISEGWNLISVRDVTGALGAAGNDDLSASNSIDSDVYLAGLEVSRILHFNTLQNAWKVIVPDGVVTTNFNDNLGVGHGYWVYATEAGTLVP
jgi:hypothetical protein